MTEDLIKIGEVSSIDPARCTARVVFDDENSLVSYDLPVLQRNTFGNRDFQMPDVGEDVLVLFLGPGQEDGIIVGSFYAGEVSPPEATSERRTIVFKDGTRLCYDRQLHKFTMTIEGASVEIDRSSKTVKVPKAFSVECTTALVKASSSVTIDSPSTSMTGTLTVAGLITGQGGFTVTGGGGVLANCNIQLQGSMVATGNVTAGAISLVGHTHTGVHGETSVPH